MDADLHEQTAARLLRSRPARRAKSPTHAASTDVQSQRDRAALILVYEADRSARENRPADAVASYRRAIELFPQTHWAEVARQRLRLMQQS